MELPGPSPALCLQAASSRHDDNGLKGTQEQQRQHVTGQAESGACAGAGGWDSDKKRASGKTRERAMAPETPEEDLVLCGQSERREKDGG